MDTSLFILRFHPPHQCPGHDSVTDKSIIIQEKTVFVALLCPPVSARFTGKAFANKQLNENN